tara:strand:+ start:3050 stop:3514 length:465 start_codon:yes stop_codon:yes gene_type:complete
MEQNKLNKYFLILISFLSISSCQFDLIEDRHIYLNKIEFGLSVKDSFKKKSKRYFSQDPSNNNYALKISNLKFKKKNFYGGSAARAKQIEIIGELEYKFTNISSSIGGKIQISDWIPVNETNPQAEMMAQKKIVEELEFLLLDDLMKEYWLIEG